MNATVIVTEMMSSIRAIDASIAYETKQYEAIMASYASKQEAYEDVIRRNVPLITNLHDIVGKSPYDVIALDNDRRVVELPDYGREIVADANGIGRMYIEDDGVVVFYDDTYKEYYKTLKDRYDGEFKARLEIAGFYDPANPLNEGD